MAKLTKTQHSTLHKLVSDITLIRTLGEAENKRESAQRKHKLETAYAALCTHAWRFFIEVPPVGTYYSPQRYLNAAEIVKRALQARGLWLYTLAELNDMPTLTEGHTANLKVTEQGVNIWLSRLSPEDGEAHNVSIERYDKGTDKWETILEYTAK